MQAAQLPKVRVSSTPCNPRGCRQGTDQVVAAGVGVRCAAAEGRQGAKVWRLPLHIPRQPHL